MTYQASNKTVSESYPSTATHGRLRDMKQFHAYNLGFITRPLPDILDHSCKFDNFLASKVK